MLKVLRDKSLALPIFLIVEYISNSRHLARKYALKTFVRGCDLFREPNHDLREKYFVQRYIDINAQVKAQMDAIAFIIPFVNMFLKNFQNV